MSADEYAQLVEIDLLHAQSVARVLVQAPALVLWRAGGRFVAHSLLQSGFRRRGERDGLRRSIGAAHAERLLRVAMRQWILDGTPGDNFSIEAAVDRLTRPTKEPAHTPPLTVAICTRGRNAALGRVIQAVTLLLRPTDELLVILNAPGAEEPSRLAQQWPTARFVVEPRPGLSWARNHALREARHELVLFTDDDCIPDACWVSSMRQAASRNPEAEVITGRIEPLSVRTAAQWQFEAYRGFPGREARRWVLAPREPVMARVVGSIGALGAGANFAVQRRLAHQIGGFDAALGAGTVCGGGEDLEFFFRALQKGAFVACEPDAMVRHEHREEPEALERQLHAWSRGFACAIARIAIAHPEEARGLRRLRTRIALLHHGRRALISSFRQLARAEWSGMQHADRHYAEARRTAERLAALVPSETTDTPPTPRGARESTRSTPVTVTRRLDIAEAFGPLAVGEGIDRLHLAISARGRTGGEVTLDVRHGMVGADRVVDAIIDAAAFRGAARSLLGITWHKAQRQAALWFGRAVESH